MKTRINVVLMLALALTLIGAALTMATQAGAGANVPPPRPKGPCDIYAADGDPCVAAHSTTRALYASYNGPLYQVLRARGAMGGHAGIAVSGVDVTWAFRPGRRNIGPGLFGHRQRGANQSERQCEH